MPGLINSAIHSLRSGIFDFWHGNDQPALKPGLYHYHRQVKDEYSHIHLRVEPDLSGILVVNASKMLHLNPTAVWMAFLYLELVSPEEAVKTICDRFQVYPDQAYKDYTEFVEKVTELVRPDGACPWHEMNLETTAPFSTSLSAPYRMDLALTYRCNNDCAHCYNARSRDFQETSTSEWFRILDQLWEIGIPHIVFTGGEPTLRSDLPDLIAHAQQNGQITGINTNGRRLSDPKYVEKLVEAGLDHVQITLESHDPNIHDRMVKNHGAWMQTTRGLMNVLKTRLYVMTNTTLLQDNACGLSKTLEFLANMNVPTIGLNALIYSGRGLSVNNGLQESQLQGFLELARALTDQYSQKLIWYTPTRYCQFDPVQLELGVKGCTAAIYNMCIEPNGDVLPCQSYYQALGNIQKNKWKDIWHHPLAEKLRSRQYAPEECFSCAFLQECGGGCPLSLSYQDTTVKPF